MSVSFIWLIPGLPLAAAAITALLPRHQRRWSAGLAIGAIGLALLGSLAAFGGVLRAWGQGESVRSVANFRWFQTGEHWVQLGWLNDPLAAVMLVMICAVSLLVFIYSLGYMASDPNFTRFYCFLSLFAAAMLGLVLANSLLLLFVCWELVGLASYLLIGFWYQKPEAAAAAKKAFITTRLGDLALLLGLVWLYGETGTLLFYDGGSGCLESPTLSRLAATTTGAGLALSTVIGLLIFAGAVGKSGQLPLHVWLPDAMEGPTPVSALIHAATMVAAGVFLMARVYPLLSAAPPEAVGPTGALQAIAWVGAITAFFAATIAVAQTDIKRILAYSTVSQLGFMMLGLGTGGVAAGMFHLITHAFFKALLFLGAGSVIHALHEEQHIANMGGLRGPMPTTFLTYAAGMLALSGFPLVFSGFWSKDAILHAAHSWGGSHLPFYLGLAAAALTAFYMTRQVLYVFFGEPRGPAAHAHESPAVMTAPLKALAVMAVALGFAGTPAWPWFQSFLESTPLTFSPAHLFGGGVAAMMAISAGVALGGIAAAYWLYGRQPLGRVDPLERLRPDLFGLFRAKYYIDEVYEWGVVGLNATWARACDWFDQTVAAAVGTVCGWAVLGLSWVSRLVDEYVVNQGFDRGCRALGDSGSWLARRHHGWTQGYLRVIGLGCGILVLLLLWGWVRS